MARFTLQLLYPGDH